MPIPVVGYNNTTFKAAIDLCKLYVYTSAFILVKNYMSNVLNPYNCVLYNVCNKMCYVLF